MTKGNCRLPLWGYMYEVLKYSMFLSLFLWDMNWLNCLLRAIGSSFVAVQRVGQEIPRHVSIFLILWSTLPVRLVFAYLAQHALSKRWRRGATSWDPSRWGSARPDVFTKMPVTLDVVVVVETVEAWSCAENSCVTTRSIS